MEAWLMKASESRSGLLKKLLKVGRHELRAFPVRAMSRVRIDPQFGASDRSHETVLVDSWKQRIVFAPQEESRYGDPSQLSGVVVGEQSVQYLPPEACGQLQAFGNNTFEERLGKRCV